MLAALTLGLAFAGLSDAAPGMKKIAPLPRDLEIQLALSALPPHLRDNATVYVLNPDKGFELRAEARMDSTPLSLEPAMMRSEGPGR